MDFDTLKYKVQELVRHITGKKDEDEEDELLEEQDGEETESENTEE